MFHCRLREYLDAAGRSREWFIKESGMGYGSAYQLYKGPVKRIDSNTYRLMKRIFGLNSIEDIFTLVEED